MTPARSPRSLLGLRVAALLETLVFLALALALDRHFGAGDRFAGVTPHPFWAIVLLVSAQYGAKEGLAAALLASAAFLAGNLPEQGFSEDLHAWLLRATTEPILWIFAAIGIGEIRDGHRRERDSLREELREAREQAEGLADAYERLSRLKDHLEARVAGQASTVHSIFLATRGIERQDTGEVLAGVQQLVAGAMHPRKFSLYLLCDRTLEAAFSEGWSEDDGFACSFGPSSPLHQAVVGHRRFLVATRPSHGLALGTEGLLAGPLICPDTDEVIGMLKIEEMDFLDLNPASVGTFQVLCTWIGAAYSSAQRLEEAEAARFHDPARRLLTAPLFEILRGIATATAEQVGYDLSVVYIGFGLPAGSAPALQPTAARALARAGEGLLAASEPRFDWRHDGWDAAILLPGAGQCTAEAVARRLLAAMAEEFAMAGIPGSPRSRVEVLHDPVATTSRSSAA